MMITKNKSAFFNYQIFDQFESGIVLKGSEVKSIIKNKVDLERAYIVNKDGELFLLNANIPSWKNQTTLMFTHEPLATRKLLLNKMEINRIIQTVKEQKYTLIPLDLHWNNGKIKLSFAYAKSKKIHDKRDAIKKKELIRNRK